MRPLAPPLPALLLLPPVLAACGPTPPLASLPSDAVEGGGDPTRAAIVSSAYVFGAPESTAGRPDLGARAVAQVEHLATEIPYGPRWIQFNPTVGLELIGARAELRREIGRAHV